MGISSPYPFPSSMLADACSGNPFDTVRERGYGIPAP